MEIGNKITHWAKSTINHANCAADPSGAENESLDEEQAISRGDEDMNAPLAQLSRQQNVTSLMVSG